MKKLLTALLFLLLLVPVTVVHAENATAQEKLAARLEKVSAARGMMEHQQKIEFVQTLDDLYGRPEIRASIEQATGRTIDWDNFDPLDHLKSSADLIFPDDFPDDLQNANIPLIKEALADGSTIEPLFDDCGNLAGWRIMHPDGFRLVTWASSGLGPYIPPPCEQTKTEKQGKE